MKRKYIVWSVCLVVMLLGAYTFVSRSTGKQIAQKEEHAGDEHGHGKGEANEPGHGKGEANEPGHGKGEANEPGHGKEEDDEHGHDKEEGDEHGHAKEEGDSSHGDEHGEEGGGKVGPGKAILETDKKKGFKLSPEAVKTLQVKFQTVSSSQVVIATATLATTKQQAGVYRYRNGFFKFIPVAIKQSSATEYLIEASELQSGDQIVSGGVGLIAISDVYANDTAEYSHGH